MRILIAEDEIELAKGLKYLLEKSCFTVDVVHNGCDALSYLSASSYDVVVLDIMMPGKSGLEVLARMREERNSVPVMLLTAKAEIEDRVVGLEAGADDYLPKPFFTREFVARVKSLSRRSDRYTDHVLLLGNVRLNCSTYELSCQNCSIRLNNKEFQIMELFFRHPRCVFSAEKLMDRIWDVDSEANVDVVWSYIGFLRKKLRQLEANIEIKTVRGAGYSLEERK